jgi:hypothetical protein
LPLAPFPRPGSCRRPTPERPPNRSSPDLIIRAPPRPLPALPPKARAVSRTWVSSAKLIFGAASSATLHHQFGFVLPNRAPIGGTLPAVSYPVRWAFGGACLVARPVRRR